MHSGSKTIKKDLSLINNKLLLIAEKADKLVPGIKKHLLGGGKKLRPSLLMLAYRVFRSGNKDLYFQQALNYGAVIEMLHNASLLHDDVIEGADLRRGRKTINALYGNKRAVLAGDLLTAFSMSLLYNLKSSKTMEKTIKIFGRASRELVQGEIEEVTGLFKTNITEKEYFRVISGKTAGLFVLASEAGAVLARADKKSVKAMREYGRNLGLAFQIVDDILDFTGEEAVLGKPVGSDILEGKLTLPVIYALKKADENEKEKIKDILLCIREGKKEKGGVKYIVEVLKKYGCLEAAYRTAEIYVKKAKAALSKIPDNEFRKALMKAASFTLERDH